MGAVIVVVTKAVMVAATVGAMVVAAVVAMVVVIRAVMTVVVEVALTQLQNHLAVAAVIVDVMMVDVNCPNQSHKCQIVVTIRMDYKNRIMLVLTLRSTRLK